MPATKARPTERVDRITPAIIIARVVEIPDEKKCRADLRKGLRDAIQYAWFAYDRQSDRSRIGNQSLDAQIRRIERTVEALGRALTTEAGYEVTRHLPMSEPAAMLRSLERLSEAASLATLRRAPQKQHIAHQRWFLAKVATALLDAGGRFPTYNKNRDSGGWRQIIDALQEDLPPTFLNVSPSTLAGWITRTRNWTKTTRLAASK